MPIDLASRRKKSYPFRPLWYALPPCILTGLLWLSSTHAVNSTQVGLALLLAIVPWIAFLRWRQNPKHLLPLFALISGMYWLYFGVAMFWGDTRFIIFGSKGSHIPESTITTVILMAVIGVFAMLAGTRVGSLTISIPTFTMGSPQTSAQWLYIDLIVLFPLVSIRFFSIGGDTRQAVILLLEFVPLVAFAMLFQKFLGGRATSYEKVLLVAFLLLKSATGLASGSMGSVVAIFIVVAALYLQTRRKVPKVALAALAIYVLFFQVGKGGFRERYWTNQVSGGTIQRLTDWVGFSLKAWGFFYDHPSAERFQILVSQSFSRLSLLPMAAAVVERTPNPVPYQNGKLYSYMLITLIPRFVWPEKPSFNEANQFFQVAYGLTRLRDLGNSSIAVGVLAESFINFGWTGVVVIMFLMGVFISVFQSIFFMPKTPMVLAAIGVVLLPSMLAIESQLVQYFGGMIQQVLVAYCVMLPITAVRRKMTTNRRMQGEALAIPSR